MNIAIITPGGLPVPPVKGGAVESLIWTIIKQNEYSDKPVELTVYSIDDKLIFKDKYKQEHVNYKFIKKNYVYNNISKTVIHKILSKFSYKYRQYPFFYNLVKKLKDKQFDYILVENRPDYIIPISEINSSKIILHLHNDYIGDNLYKFTDLEKKEILMKCDKVIVVSNYIKTKIIDRYNELSEKLYVLPNGIDNKLFSNKFSEEHKLMIKKKYKINENDFVIIFVGRLNKEKGILQLVTAMDYFKHYDDIKIIIVGSSWFSSKFKTPFIKKLEGKSKEIKDKIIFTGYIDNNELPELYSISDVAVMPSMCEEGQGLVILESMSMGLPVISTNSGGIPESLTNECGIILDRDSDLEKNIAKNINDIYMDRNMGKIKGKNGMKRVREYFTSERYYAEFIKILNENI